MSYIAAPGEIISVYAQYNDTAGSAAAATTPTVSAILYNSVSGEHEHIAGSPYDMAQVPESAALTGWVVARITIPVDATVGAIIGLRFTGLCDGENPASSDQIIVRSVELTDAVLTAAHGSGAWTTAVCGYLGDGENAVSITMQVSGVGVLNERVVVRNGAGTIVGAGYTDADGIVLLQLDDGTYYARYGPTSRYEYSNDYDVVVSGDTDVDPFSCTALSFPDCGYTLAQMKSQVITALLDVYPDRMPDSLVEKWVEDGHLYLDMALKWTKDVQEVTTEADVARYELTDTNRNIVAVVYDDDAVLVHQEFEEHLRDIDASTTSGDPTHWAVWGDYIYFYPIPDTADITITLYVVKAPAKLGSDEVKPALPCELHRLIIDYALSRAYAHLTDTASAMIHYNLFMDGLGLWRGDVSEYRTGRTHVVDTDDF